MTDQLAQLLVRVGEFLKKLPPEQVAALAAGEARLDVVPKGARITGAKADKPAPKLDLDVTRVESDLKAIGDRDAATQYLKDLKLGKPLLLQLASELNVSVTKSATMTVIIGRIVEQKVGYHLDARAIMGRS